MKNGKEKKSPVRTSGELLKGRGKVEAVEAIAAKTWRDAVSNVLTDVAKSAHKTVVNGVEHILHTLEQSAHNWFACGQELLAIAGAVNERQFTRLINEVFSRFGLSKPTIYRWMDNVEVLTGAVPYEPARDALLTVFGGLGIITRKDGKATLNGSIALGFKKYPVPATGNYHDCLDWAREVQVIAEKSEKDSKTTMEEFSKALRGRFEKLLAKRYDLAVEVVVYCFRFLEAKSEVLAASALEAIEDSSIAPATAGKSALAALAAAEKAAKVTTNANVAA